MARNLNPYVWLGDGALITHLSVTTRWVYAQVLKDGRLRRRRYRLDADVEVEPTATQL